MSERFSRRYGYGPNEAEITVRDDAPYAVRAGLLKIAQGEVGIGPGVLRDVLCTVLRTLPDSGNWSDSNVWAECQTLIESAPWYRVYDFVEALYRRIGNTGEVNPADQWAQLVNEFFVETGVGWRLVDGQLERRGEEGFESTVDMARTALESVGLPTARTEIQEALRDLSRRPEPDLTGAVQHAMAALECTAREVTGDSRGTLGEILKRNPDLIPRPLDESLTKLWGYSSEMARHVREGRTPLPREAELVVSVSAAACSFLVDVLRESRT
jgi:hypothetical protein